MSPAMMRMYISFVGMFFLFVASILILWARYKLSGWFRALISTIAYVCLIVGGFIIMLIVIGGPTAE